MTGILICVAVVIVAVMFYRETHTIDLRGWVQDLRDREQHFWRPRERDWVDWLRAKLPW